MKVYYNEDFTLAKHAFETTRKPMWIADSLVSKPIPGVELVAPKPVTLEQLVEVHSPDYLNALRTGEPKSLAESQGFEWDPGLWKMVLATTGGAVAAALTAFKKRTVSGSLSSGLHHARRDRGAGFCSVNGLVLAAKAVLAAGARKVLILDLDAHGGGGTYSLIRDDPRIAMIDVVTSPFDTYDPEDKRFYLKVFPEGDKPGDAELALMEGMRQLDEIGFAPDITIYNAGMDPYTTYTRDALLRESFVFNYFCKRLIPMAFVLAGGYLTLSLDQIDLVRLHRATIAEAALTAAILKRREDAWSKESRALEDAQLKERKDLEDAAGL